MHEFDNDPRTPSSPPGRPPPAFSMRIVSGLTNFKLVFNRARNLWELQPAEGQRAPLTGSAPAWSASRSRLFWFAIGCGIVFIIVGAAIAGTRATSANAAAASAADGGASTASPESSSAAPTSPVSSATTTTAPVASFKPTTAAPVTTNAPVSKSPTSSLAPVTSAAPVSKSPTSSLVPTTASPTSTRSPGSSSTYAPIPSSQLLVISPSISVFVPRQICAPENCPPGLGTCDTNTNTCVFNATSGYAGLQTYPHAYATEYCELTSTGCLGVTYINTPHTTATYIGGNFSMPLCEEMGSPQTCVGIFASPSRMNGNAQTATYPNGTQIYPWGMGLTEASGVCYQLTGPTGHVVLVAQTDRCGGYCTCSAQASMAECGPCVSDPKLTPNCPCVGTVPGQETQCCGLSTYGCPSTQQECDWCASQNHPHFDLDVATFNYLCDTSASQGSCELSAAQPVPCLTPLPWPPGGGGGGSSSPQCTSGQSWDCSSGTNDPVNQVPVTNCPGCCCNWQLHPSGVGCGCS